MDDNDVLSIGGGIHCHEGGGVMRENVQKVLDLVKNVKKHSRELDGYGYDYLMKNGIEKVITQVLEKFPLFTTSAKKIVADLLSERIRSVVQVTTRIISDVAKKIRGSAKKLKTLSAKASAKAKQSLRNMRRKKRRDGGGGRNKRYKSKKYKKKYTRGCTKKKKYNTKNRKNTKKGKKTKRR